MKVVNPFDVSTLVVLEIVEHVEIGFIGGQEGVFVGIIVRDGLLE
jgi:hypothetical protein